MGLVGTLKFDELARKFMSQYDYKWWESWYSDKDKVRWFRFHRSEPPPKDVLTLERYDQLLKKIFEQDYQSR